MKLMVLQDPVQQKAMSPVKTIEFSQRHRTVFYFKIKTFYDFHNNLSLSPLLKHLAYPEISVPFLVHCLKAAIFVIYQKLLSLRQVPNAGRIDSFRIVL